MGFYMGSIILVRVFSFVWRIFLIVYCKIINHLLSIILWYILWFQQNYTKKAKICSNIPKPIPKCTFWNFIGTDFRKISGKDVVQEVRMSVYQSWMFDARFFQLKVASLTSCWSSRIANRIKHHRFTP